MTGAQMDAGVSTQFVWITGWTPHPLDFQGSVVRESVAVWAQQATLLSDLLAVAVSGP